MAASTAQKTADKIDAATYDAVPYESYSYPHTHPSMMHAVGTLFGLSPIDFRKAKVLELGCASGGNLFSQALIYPKADFFGIDLSAEQIALANKARDAIGAKNVRFEQMDITKFDMKKYEGHFDYIICHGVYSWVPETVREKILELCDKCLAPQGLALISYNTLPGWNAVRSLREMMLFHANRFENPADKIKQAKALLKFLSENVSEGRGGYKALIEEERKMLDKTNDSYIFHDHLEHTNAQFYFHQFMESAVKNNLAYVGDSAISSMFVGNMPKGAMEALKAVNDAVGQEQYMDFVTNRRFRNTILCKMAEGAKIKRNLDENAIFKFYLQPSLRPEEGKTTAPMNFISASGGVFTANDDTAVQLYLELCAAGNRPIQAEKLINNAQKRMGAKDDEALRKTLRSSGLRLALHGYMGLLSDGCTAVEKAGAKPEVFKWARYQAAQPGCTNVTNMTHALVNTDPAANAVMVLMDGTRTLDQVVDGMVANVKDGTLTVRNGDNPVTDEKIIRDSMKNIVDQLVVKLAQQNLMAA